MSEVVLLDTLVLAAGLVLAAALGWLAGLLSALVARAAVPVEERRAQDASRCWLQDVSVQGGVAVVWAALWLAYGPTWQWLAAAVLALPLVQVTVTDFRERYVYYQIAGAGLLAGLLLNPVVHQGPWWAGLAGAIGGGLALLLLYGLGRLLYRGQEPLATGDIAIGALVGAVAGPHTAWAIIAGVFFSGLLALGTLLVVRSRHAYIPYGPGLCLGGLLALFW